MAHGKTKEDILKNEQYMNDVVNDALYNLHRAARRKSEYVWSTQKFNSMDSIWGDPAETETNVDDARNVTKTLNHGPNFFKLHDTGTDTRAATNKQSESNEIETKVKRNNAPKIEPYYVPSRKSALLENFAGEEEKIKPEYLKNGTSNMKTAKLEDFSQTSSVNRPYESYVRHKINPEVINCDANNERFQGNFPKKEFGYASPIKTEDFARNTLEYAEQTSRIKPESNIERNKEMKSHRRKTEISSDYSSSSKINSSEMHPQKKAHANIKRKIHHSSSSVNSLLPEPKNLPGKNQKYKIAHGFDKSNCLLDTMVILKIFKGDKFFDFLLELSAFDKIKIRFPKLQEVFPKLDEEEKEIGYSAYAVRIVLGSLLNMRYDAPDERTAVEVLAASKSFEMAKFHNEFRQRFLKIINGNNSAYMAAVHYGLSEICDAYKLAFNDSDLFDKTRGRSYKEKTCYLSVSTYIEPRELCIPLKIASISSLNDNFDRDMRNEISFKAIEGSYVITGFHILLNVDKDNDADSNNLYFFYVVKAPQNDNEEEVKVEKPLRSIIAIHFKRNITVNQNQTVELIVETSIKPFLCSSIQEKAIERYDEGKYCLSMKSNFKVTNSNEERFFIGKLLYYPKT